MIMPNEIQEAIFLNTEGWHSYNVAQAAPEDAHKSKNQPYLVSLTVYNTMMHSTMATEDNGIG